MKNYTYKIIVALLIFGLGLNITYASFFKADSEFKINDEIEGNTYLAGEKIDFDTKVTGDLFIAGQYLNITGEITKDTNLAGQFIDVKSNIGEDLRVAGQDIKISNKINGESIIFGETIIIENDAELNGETLIYAKTITINGIISGNTNLKAENIIINGSLDGENNQLVSANLEIANNANINQNTKYWAENYQIPTNLEPNLILDNSLEVKNTPEEKNNNLLNISGLIILRIIWASTIIIILHLLFSKRISKHLEKLNSTSNYIESFVLGFFAILLVPIASIALMLTFIGLPLGAIILVLYFMILFIGQSITSLYLSNLLNIKLKLKVPNIQIYLMALGIYTLFLLTESIPYPYADTASFSISSILFLVFIGNFIINLRLKENK